MNKIPILRSFGVLFFCCLLAGASQVYGQSNCQISGNTTPCQNSEVEYLLTHNAPAPFKVSWQVIGGVGIDEGPTSITVGWTLSGTQQIIAVITGPSGIITTCNLSVNVLPVPTIPPLPEFNICGSDIVQVSTTDCPGCTYNWTTEGDLSITPNDQFSASLSINGSGQYCVELTTANGCVNSTCASVNSTPFEILPVTVTGAAPTDPPVPNHWEVCPNQAINFSVAEPKGLDWIVTDGINFWSFSGPEISFNFPTPGAYAYTVTGTNIPQSGFEGTRVCQAIEPQIIHVSTLPPVPISCPSVVCEGDEITYTVPANCSSSSMPWEVSPQGTIVGTPTATSITVIWSYDDADPVGYVIYNGSCPMYCSGPSIIQVPIIPSQGTINGPDGICNLPSTLTWSAPNFIGGLYNWSFSPNPSTGVTQVGSNTSNTYKLKFANGFQGSITLRLEFTHPIAGCSYIVEKTVTYTSLFPPIVGNKIICADEVGEDHTYTYGYSGNLDWILEHQNGPVILTGNTTSPHSFTIPANTFQPGRNYSLTVVNDGGCTRSLLIEVLTPAFGEIVGSTEVCPNVSYTYTVEPPPALGESIIWTFVKNGIPGPNPVVGPSIDIIWPPTTGSLEVTRELHGCETLVDHIDITVLPPNVPLEITGDAATCPDIIQSYSASPESGAAYIWTITDPATGLGSNIGSIYSGQGTAFIDVQWLGVETPTVVNLNVSTEICGVLTTATLTITITPFQLTLQTPNICEGESGQLFANVTSASGYSVYLDGNEIYKNAASLNPIPAMFLGVGTHTVLLVVRDPNGCAGPVTASSTMVVHPNPTFKISLSDNLPCPKAPFTRHLSVSPSSPGCSYQWYRNGVPYGPNAPLVKISAEGVYTVVVTCGNCPPKSAEFLVFYDCDDCCEFDPEGNDITVQMTACSLSVNECNLIEFAGTITPFALAHDPKWIIELPGGEFLEFPIDPAGVNGNQVTGSYQADGVGLYRVYLSANEIWEDIYILAQIPHSSNYIIFLNFCDFNAAGGPGSYPNYQVIHTGSAAYCARSAYRNIQVPFIADFSHQVLCNANGTFQVLADDNSLYDTGVTSTIEWTYPGGSQSGPSLNIPSVGAGIPFELCMQVTDQADYICSHCKTIQIPAQVSVGIDVVSQNLCQFQSFQFNPLIYPVGNEEYVVSYFWTFGDGTFSYTEAPFKVYTIPGSYTVELTAETKDGCFITKSITVIVNDNNLPEGTIAVDPGACNSTALLSFVQSAGPPVTDYLWNPANDNQANITVASSGNYSLIVIGSNGCSNTVAPVEVTLDDPFPLTITPWETCGGIHIFFNSQPNYNYEWTWSPATPAYPQPSTGTSLNLNNIAPGTYQVTSSAFQNGTFCTSKELTIQVRPLPVIPVLTQSVACTNGEMWAVLTVTNAPADVEITWPNLGLSGPSSVQVNANGIYTVRFTNSEGCFSQRNIVVSNIIDFSTFLSGCYDCTILDNGPVYLNGIPGSFDSWYWEIDGLPLSIETGAITPLLLSTAYEKIRLCITQDGCSLCSEPFCLIDCEEETCQIPAPTIRRIQCLDETIPGAPGMTRYFAHWDFPTDGIVMPCPTAAPDIFVAGLTTPVGQFEAGQFQFEEIPGFWHFEGVFLLNQAYSPAQVCWGIPFCLISTGAQCNIAQVCPVDYPYDPYYACTNPNGPSTECADMVISLVNVVCEEDPNTSITHLVTLHIEATAPPTTCGQYAVQITSITGDLLYPISGQLYDLTGPTISTNVTLGWASNTANDILCLEVNLREDYDCWPLTFLDDPSTPANEAGKICLKRECFNLTEAACPEHIPSCATIEGGFVAICDGVRSHDGVSVYNVTITLPFPAIPASFSLTPLSGSILNLNISGNTITFQYLTVPGNLLFFATMINNRETYCIQKLLEDCGFIRSSNPRAVMAENGSNSSTGQLQVFPNPASSMLHIQYRSGKELPQTVQLDIYDLHGRRVRHLGSNEHSSAGNWVTSVQDWSPGLYLVVLRDSSGQILESQKLVVGIE